MKKLTFSFLTLLLLSGSSCSDFLNRTPVDFIAPETFYSNNSEATAAVTGIYDKLGNYFGLYAFRIHLLGDLATDDHLFGRAAGTLVEINSFTYDPNLREIPSVWEDSYKLIANANMAIKYIPAAPRVDAALKTRLEGEARFLRALGYLNLVRFFGDVPLLTEPTETLENLDVARTPAQEVYDQILADLDIAEKNLPRTYANADRGRATQGAAKALMARTLMTMASTGTPGITGNRAAYWQRCADKCKEIVDANTYSLQRNYADIFRKNNEYNSEVVFDVQFRSGLGVTSAGEGHTLSSLNVPITVPNGGQNFRPRPQLFNAFERTDTRRTTMFWESFQRPGTTNVIRFEQPYVFKYVDIDLMNAGQAPNDGGINFQVIRYADVLLMYAEALTELNRTAEALPLVNQVRARAGVPNLTETGQTALRELIYRERRLELFSECIRWFDLARWGRLVSNVKALNDPNVRIDEKHKLWPIPQAQRDVSPVLTQNAGW